MNSSIPSSCSAARHPAGRSGSTTYAMRSVPAVRSRAIASAWWRLLALAVACCFAVTPAAAIEVPGKDDDGVPEGYRVVEGDIQVPISKELPSEITPMGTYANNQWSSGTVPYFFDPAVTASQRETALAAMAMWESVGYGTNIEFLPISAPYPWLDHVYIRNSTASNSAVGRQGGLQIVNIFDWTSKTIAHELGHALGFWHEQSRADRSSKIRINWENICQNCCTDADGNPGPCDHDFDIRSSGGEWGPYDFGSIMHYDECGWSNSLSRCWSSGEGATITLLPPNEAWQHQIGKATQPSTLDRIVMSFLYALPDWRFVDASYSGVVPPMGSFRYPHPTFDLGVSSTPTDGTLWISPGDYVAVIGVYDQPMLFRAPLGDVKVTR